MLQSVVNRCNLKYLYKFWGAVMEDAFEGRFEKLTSAFTERLRAELDTLEQFSEGLQNNTVDTELFDQVKYIAHRLAGASRVFGYNELTASAQAVETLIAERGDSTAIAEETRRLAEDIRRAVSA